MIAWGRAQRAVHAATRYRKDPALKLEVGMRVVEDKEPQALACRMRLEVVSSWRLRVMDFEESLKFARQHRENLRRADKGADRLQKNL